MYATSVFIYTQRQIVVLQVGNSPRIYMPVYAKTLTLHKGVDNQIQFQFLNQAQKPVDITGKNIVCRLISYDGNKVLLTKSLTLLTPLTGIAALEVGPAEIDGLPSQRCYYSLEIPSGSFNYPVFVDPSAGARGDIDIVDSVLPRFVESMPVTIPSQMFPNTMYSNGVNVCVALSGQNVVYSTSSIDTGDANVLTIQMTLEGFWGKVDIEGSTLPDSSWYPITSSTYSNTSNTFGYTIHGYHPFVRVTYTSNNGAVTNVLAR